MSTTYTTTDAVGIVEDVDDVISNLTPSKTPFLTSIGSDITNNIEFKWQEDKLRKSKANAQKEGADAVAVARVPTVMRRNGVQIFSDTFKISGTEDRVKQYGRAKETAYQTVKVGKELKLDVENAYVSDATYVERVADTTAGVSAGFSSQIDASVTVDAAAADIGEDMILEASEKVALQGGTPTILMIRLADAKLVAGFTGNAVRQRMVGTDEAKKIVNSVDVYVTPFHELRVVKNIEMNDYENAFLLDPEMAADVTLRGWQREQLAKTGDATTTQVLTERGLKVRNFFANGRIKNLKAVGA